MKILEYLVTDLVTPREGRAFLSFIREKGVKKKEEKSNVISLLDFSSQFYW